MPSSIAPSTASTPLDGIGNPTSFVGEPLTNTPKWQLAVKGEYEFAVSDNHEAFFRANGSYQSSAQAQLGHLPQFVIDGYTLIDLAAGVRTQDGKWEVELWGRNITNKTYSTGIYRLTDTLTRTTGMPATYGVSVRYRM